LEINSNIYLQQAAHFQQQRQVCAPLWIWDVESHQHLIHQNADQSTVACATSSTSDSQTRSATRTFAASKPNPNPNQGPITQQIGRRKWRWIGHTLRKPSGDITRHALDWNPQGKRRVGRPKTTWRRSCEGEMKTCGLTWGQLEKAAPNRERWGSVAEALCSARIQRE
jgi:hypothetical protein